MDFINSLFVLNIHNVLFWVLVTWHYALFCGYVSDDHAVIAGRLDIIPDEEKAKMQKEKDEGKTVEPYWTKVFNDGVVMYYLNWVLFKLKMQKIPFIWHLLTLGVHLGNIYLLNMFLTPLVGAEVSLVACLFWGINPMLNQNTVWISGRPYSIALMLVLIGAINWHNPIIFFPLYMLAVITNISVALMPVIMKFIYPEAWQTTVYLVLMLACGLPFVLWKFHKRFTSALVIDRENFRFKARRIFTIIRIYGYYMWTFFVPVRMGWYHQAGFRYNEKWEKFNIWTLASLASCGIMATQGWQGVWWFAGILPNANLFATNSFVQERYLYFGSIGLCVAIAPFLHANPSLLLVAVTFYAVRAYMYSRNFKDDEGLYRENWRNHPKSDYAVNNLAYFLIQQHRYEEARVIILRGINMNDRNKMLWYNLGVTWAAQGNLNNDEGKFRFLRAVDCWKMALQIEPRWKKPSDDLQRMIQFLLDNKVISMNAGKGEASGANIDIPVDVTKIKGLKNG